MQTTILVTEKLKFVLGRLENNEEKGENAGYQNFLPLSQCFLKTFQKVSFLWSLSRDSVIKS